MAVEVQDNAREKELRELFGLSKDVSAGRSGVDAYIIFKGKRIEFELKSTTTGSVTTVRDFGPDHIEKWKNKHWIIGCYSSSQDLKYTIYGPPDMMEEWIKEKEQYIALDFELAETIPQHTSIEDMNSLISEKNIYTLDDAKMIQKKQYKIDEYKELMDSRNGYSPDRMLEILRARVKYLIKRGSTLNNPHIPKSYFDNNFPDDYYIKENHELKLRNLLKLHA